MGKSKNACAWRMRLKMKAACHNAAAGAGGSVVTK